MVIQKHEVMIFYKPPKTINTFTLTPFAAGVCRCPKGGLHLGQGEPQEGGEAGDQEVVLHANPGVGAAASSYRVLSSL